MEDLRHWLTTTILGIVVLGAIGSILAYMVMRLAFTLWRSATLLFTTVLPKHAARLAAWIKKRRSDKFFKYGYDLGLMLGLDEVRGLTTYLISHSLFAVLWLIVSVGCLVMFTLLFFLLQQRILTVGVYILLVGCILAGRQAYHHLLLITLSFRNFRLVVNAKQEVQLEMQVASHKEGARSSVARS